MSGGRSGYGSYAGSSQYDDTFSAGGSVRSYCTTATRYTAVENPQNTLQDLAPMRLPCEFIGLGCNETFSFNEVDAWTEHVITDHLGNKLPSIVACWFCDTWRFDCNTPNIGGDQRYNFDLRMNHIYEHFLDGKSVHDIRPDFYMIEHLGKNGLVATTTYHYLKRWNDVPCPIEEMRHIQRRDFVPPERQERQRRSEMVFVDNDKEERRRKKEKAHKGKGNRDKPSHRSK
ncbi:uncharacterized protein F4812DRAFT_169596 [Daldinia caldariorum]|uniref:uncharacterized protein n=1 Tax=Daldinia caldariorum TaxID=326644 RepID=UPI0020078CD8|nr:uncharacterized protein F4812DRAFT_169596 [Daldinia caldariorum]KAI1471184.1 hypothetical protein F4812DRAFT_169596 [Daldinia caldariorum]